MADKAHIATDKKLAEMEAHLSAIYDQAEKEIEAKAAAYFKQFEKLDEQKRKLVEEGKLTEEAYKEWRRRKITYGKHWTNLKAQLAEEYANINRTALAYINGKLPEVYALNYNDIGAELDDKVKGYSFELVDAQTVKNLATKDDTLLPYKDLDGVKDVRWNTQKVNAAVLQGILQGESIPHLAKRLQSVTNMNKVSAIRNARTTITSAECKGRQDSYEKATQDGIELKREWISAIDFRTRHAHVMLDGKLSDVDKPFDSELGPIMYPGDPSAKPENVYNCRCTIAAKVISIGGVKVDKLHSKSFGTGDATEKQEINTHQQIGTVDFGDTNAIMRVLENAQKDSNNLSYENCHIVTNDGKVWNIKGDSTSVNIGDIPSSLMHSYSYHNHPSNQTWYSFSAEDVGMFMEYKQRYSKASDDIYEYIMRRTKDTVDLDYNTVYNIFKEIEKTDVMLMKWEGIIDPDIDGYHSVMEILSKRYHFEYERRKMND